MTAAPIFVVGSPRSGTSILTWSLGQHPNILPVEESNWMAKFAVELSSSYDVGIARGERSNLSSMGVTRELFFEHFGRAIDALILGSIERFTQLSELSGVRNPDQVKEGFKLIRSEADRKTRWVDGTPEYSFAIVGLRKLFPKAKFIHIVRDVRAVVRSMMTFDAISDKPLVQTEQEAYEYWYRAVSACHAAEQALGRRLILRVRHSDLASDPEATIRRCLAFAGESFSPTCIEPLKTKINSSSAARDYTLDSTNVDPQLVAEAEALSDEMLQDAQPAYRANRRNVQQLETEFSEEVTFAASLGDERMKLLSELRRLEGELRGLATWARVQQVREAVRSCIPLGATVIITAPPGDPLLQLDGREAWGFPRNWNAPTVAARCETSLVEELDQLRRHGAGFLVLTPDGRSRMKDLPTLDRSLENLHTIWSDEACEILQIYPATPAGLNGL